ncbi:hypothetical protein [Amycolatopsis samaneae]|uniref:Secreted protein n=1 Tax=Amycolatopsis samaneae TaxID=664691 RepID=A0ABW5GFD3_9PSEU
MALWESALLTGLGGALTATGAWLGFRWQAREARKVKAADLAREDRYRLHNDRKEYYLSFYRAAGEARHALHALRKLPEGEESAEALKEARAARTTVWEAYTAVRLIGAEPVRDKANPVFSYVSAAARLETRFDLDRFDRLLREFIVEAREELTGHDAPARTMP